MNSIFSGRLIMAAAIFLTVISCIEDADHDKSLTLNEYIKLGMPDPDRNWTSHDFALAFSVLQSVKNSNPHQLPLKDSKKSGEIFVRMLNLDNMQFINDEGMSSEKKERISENFLRVCENAVKLYTMDTPGLHYYHRELTDAYLFGLEVSEIMLYLNNQTSPITPFDPSNAVQSYYLSGLFNLLRTQNYTSRFSENDHRLIIRRISKSINKNKYWFNDMVIEDLKSSFQLISDSTNLSNYSASYEELMEVL